MVQWSAVWHRYATAAVAMEQMTWPTVLSHANQMYNLAEEERISGTGPAPVFVYDELLRKSIATTAEWGDPSLDLMTAFGEVEKQVLEAARTRLLQTGFSRQQNQWNQNGQDANSRAKDDAEAERLALKASQAAKELRSSKPSWIRRWLQCQRTRTKAAAKTVARNAPTSRRRQSSSSTSGGRASRRKGGRKATALSGRGGR